MIVFAVTLTVSSISITFLAQRASLASSMVQQESKKIAFECLAVVKIIGMQRSYNETIALSPILSIISITTSALTLNQSLFNVIVIGSIAAALPLSISYERERARTLKIERELPRFLRYLGEQKKLRFSILTAIERSSNESYNRTFSSIIKSALGKMRLGLSLYQSAIALKVRYKLCRMIFFTLGNLIETGEGLAATFEIMASYLEEYNMQRSKVRQSLYLYSVLGYLSPLILVVCLSPIHPLWSVSVSLLA